MGPVHHALAMEYLGGGAVHAAVNNLTPLSSEAKGNAPAAAARPFAADVAPITRTCHASLCD